MNRFWKIINTTVLTLVILLSLLIIISSLNIGGHTVFTVKSGSMEPAIKAGSVVFDKKQENYKVGDIITFKVENSKDTITHRIIGIAGQGLETNFIIKGDANSSPDTKPVMKSNVVGKVLFSIPYLGYLVSFAKTLAGLIILIIIPATIIVYEEIVKIKGEVIRIRNEKIEDKKIKKVSLDNIK